MTTVAIIFFIYKGHGPIQARIRERKWNLFSCLHCSIAKNRQIRGHQMHEKKVR